MDTIKVKVRDDIVTRGGGFYDIAGKQKIMPQKATEVIEVKETPFVRSKIATGELIVVSRKSIREDIKEFKVFVNDKFIKAIPIDGSMDEKDVLELVYSDKMIIKAINDRDIMAVEKTDTSITIRTK
ncbi:MAG: hypothetical protein Kow00102_05760 [Spirochaetota bacterium]|nr:hypothetical protein [Spirochaetota bacterium]